MMPSAVPNEFMGLTQVEEMLIAPALPLMHIYVKPGGQRDYSGHCVNLPKNITEQLVCKSNYYTDILNSKSKITTLNDDITS